MMKTPQELILKIVACIRPRTEAERESSDAETKARFIAQAAALIEQDRRDVVIAELVSIRWLCLENEGDVDLVVGADELLRGIDTRIAELRAELSATPAASLLRPAAVAKPVDITSPEGRTAVLRGAEIMRGLKEPPTRPAAKRCATCNGDGKVWRFNGGREPHLWPCGDCAGRAAEGEER